ncbi:MAG: arsenic resistance N-acetyltransferase ArsN2 [Gemmatimonadales bacterium]|nr:arsenic resistance N-acetyltransferase ArsN2 [Gemmatimonadales bacterium]
MTLPSTAGVTLRAATAADLPAVQALLTEAGLPLDGVAEWIGQFRVAAAPGVALAGVAGFERHGEVALLRSVAVAPAWRGTGLARRLVEGVLADAEASGAREAFLLTTTAEGYFPRLGFSRVPREAAPAALGASAEFRGACPASAVLMRRPLGAPPAAVRVLVLCTGNSARSQIAEALFATLGAGRVVAASAGSRPAARVNPYAVTELARHGIAWEGRTPKTLEAVAGEHDLVVTVCGNADAACPVIVGARARVHWGLPDPAEETEPARAAAAFAATYAALEARVRALLTQPIEQMAPGALSSVAAAVHAAAAEAWSPTAWG